MKNGIGPTDSFVNVIQTTHMIVLYVFLVVYFKLFCPTF